MENIKLIASDLDGTLLLNGAQSCDPRVFPLIEELAKKNVYFAAASGRQYQSLQKLFAPVKDKIIYICENGALVMHTNQVLVKKCFEDSLAMEICHEVMDHPDCDIIISGERTCYMIPKTEEFVRYIRDDVGNHVTIVDSPERIPEEIIKISYFTAEEKQKDVMEYFKSRFAGCDCELMVSGNNWVDFAATGTGKGEALEALGEKLGILPGEMAAFGDNENDRTMLSFVGHPYLMENCNPTMENVPAKRCRKVEESLEEILVLVSIGGR